MTENNATVVSKGGTVESINIPEIIRLVVNDPSKIRVIGRLDWHIPHPHSHGESLLCFGISPDDKFIFRGYAKSEEEAKLYPFALGAEIFAADKGGIPIRNLVDGFVETERKRLGIDVGGGVLCFYVAVSENPQKVIVFSAVCS